MSTCSRIPIPSDAEREILEILDKEEQLSGGSIFQKSKNITHKYVHTALGRMEDKGYLTSVVKPDGEGKREVFIYQLTDLGKKLATAWNAYKTTYESLQPQK